MPAVLLSVCAAFFLGIVFPNASLAGPAPALEGVIDRLQQIYEKTQDFQAGFIYDITSLVFHRLHLDRDMFLLN